jgi:hypothetical protein
MTNDALRPAAMGTWGAAVVSLALRTSVPWAPLLIPVTAT